ncbi:DedA family protein [Bacillus kwashiorkori]|uniref:DedA family protein n=1 Tax=Bacillus kwashiorkori TaxID=1522318 RepID=UPI0007822F23|nr:DedA family protein [Bacillus kwashiorkori]
MQEWITDFMEQFGYIGVFLLICLENIFPPIPSEIILTFGGFMTTKTNLTVIGVVTAATIGSISGAIMLFWLGRWLSLEKLEKVVDQWGHIIRLTKKDIEKANRWFTKYGFWTVFICRLVPLLRSIISIPAGMAKMPLSTFIFLTSLGTVIWNMLLVATGAFLGESWQDILIFMDIYSRIVYIGIIIILIVIFSFFIIRLKKKSS